MVNFWVHNVKLLLLMALSTIMNYKSLDHKLAIVFIQLADNSKESAVCLPWRYQILWMIFVILILVNFIFKKFYALKFFTNFNITLIWNWQVIINHPLLPQFYKCPRLIFQILGMFYCTFRPGETHTAPPDYLYLPIVV